MFLEISQNTQESTCARVSFLIKLLAKACKFIKKETLAQPCKFIKKETLAQMFSFEIYKISKNAFFTEHPQGTASAASTVMFRRLFCN